MELDLKALWGMNFYSLNIKQLSGLGKSSKEKSSRGKAGKGSVQQRGHM